MFNLLAQTYTTTTTSSSAASGGVVLLALLLLIFSVVTIVAMWKVFEKAGRPGWAAIVPVYNIWVLFEIVGFPGWIALLAFIPFVNIAVSIVALVAYFKLAKQFGKSDLFAVLTLIFPYIMLCILAFGDAKFLGDNSGAPQGPIAPAPQTPAVPEAPQQPTSTTPPTPPTTPVV